ncbi:MAG: phosphate ABC transporter substrate-binding protein [Thiohalomonadales bacterium]
MTKRRIIFSLLLSLIALYLSACGKSDIEKLILTGSSTVAPLAMELARAFEKTQAKVRIDVQTGGSSRGVADTRAGLATIGMVSRALKPSETDLLAHTIAYDGVTPIINKKNPIDSLSNAQIVAIYQGKVKNWSQVGGPDKVITVVNKAEGHSTLELFLTYFKLTNREIKADIVIGDNQQGIKTVLGNPWAIGYVSIGSAEYEEHQGSAIKLLGVGGIAATTAMVKQGRYPLSRPLNLVTINVPQGLSKAFIAFAQSSQANAIIEQQYFIPANAH